MKDGHKNKMLTLEGEQLMRFHSIRAGAKNRELSFTLKAEHVRKLWQADCIYCDCAQDDIGIDRVDNTRGYEPDNIVLCCWYCNTIKRDKLLLDFLKYCKIYHKNIYDHFNINDIIFWNEKLKR
ncbi:MAG: hypothetical protein ACYC2U_04645 [Candidatus Amoebophilus sp.]